PPALGPGRGCAQGRGARPDAAGLGRGPSDRGSGVTPVSPGPAHRGVCPHGTDRCSAGGADRGPGDGGQQPGTVVGSGAVSAPGCIVVAARGGTVRGGRSLLPAGPRRGASSAGQVPGTPCRHEPEPAVAAAGQAGRSTRAAGTDLRLVHRGL